MQPRDLVSGQLYLTHFFKVRTLLEMLRIAIDIGGTFTDVVADTGDGLVSVKVLTSQKSPEVAALQGVSDLLQRLSKNYSDIDRIVHGTTLATNALIERKGAKTAFITTAGFRDVIEMRYEKRFDQYALDIQMPEPLVPRPLRLGLAERVLADGSVLTSPLDADIDSLCDVLREQDVESVAIGFLHSYRNSVNENYVARRLKYEFGDALTICQSAEVAGEIREYQRFSTVCANAYVRPLMTRYLNQLNITLKTKGFTGSFLMMLSDGALTTVENATRFPIRLVEGGPAGGVALGAQVATDLGSQKTLSLDIGGTTAKICFIQDGKPQTTRLFEVARAWRNVKGSGLPVKVPAVELVEIGAGGGSIAHVDTLSRLRVGPLSAGSQPGPAAYNLGGNSATITDAHLSLGNLSADGFADGIIELDSNLATQAIKTDIQLPLEFLTPEKAAAGIIELADETMANAARVHGVELGLDVASFDLLVSGGGGGLHAVRIAEKLGIRRIIVPIHAGVGSAVGFLRSPVAFERAISVMEKIDTIDTANLEERLLSTVSYVGSIVTEALHDGEFDITVVAEMRYCGQGLEVRVPLQKGIDLSESMPWLIQQFEDKFQRLVGFVLTDIEIELVSLSVGAFERKKISRDTTTSVKQSTPTSEGETRNVYDLQAQGSIAIPVFQRGAIDSSIIQGPLVIPESQTTTLVRPGWNVHASNQGHLVLQKAGL
ncbi:MAG: N-methylhydantoinase A/oxoprolinase/acetone carboxylase beta subunit [Halioglobus sp.]|jgi:N-methylhydantoinase A/oxoprolinase/acetone carboxylase beta subunit